MTTTRSLALGLACLALFACSGAAPAPRPAPAPATPVVAAAPGSAGPLEASEVVGAWWQRAKTRVVWPHRDSHAAVVYDDKLWVLGGWGLGSLNDVWFSTDALDWHQATETAPWPARKGHCALVFRDQIWLLGGAQGATQLADVWTTTDGVSWTQITDAAPWGGRSNHGCAVHEGQLWVLGGWGGTDKNDVWASSDGVQWRQVAAEAPWSGRNNHALEVFGGKLWVLGGWGRRADGSDGNLGDVWSSRDGASWQLAAEKASWSPRNSHTTAVYDGRLWLLGGWGEANLQEGNLNDVWSSTDGTHWHPATGQAQWLPRNGHATVVFQDKLWVIGGWSHFIGGTSVNDLWSSGG